MGLIYFYHANSQHGPFTEGQVRSYLRDGLIQVTDWARDETSANWVPLREVLARLDEAARTPKPIPISMLQTTRIGAVPLPPMTVRKQPSTPIPRIVR